jgi:hypothetical protein
MSARSWCHRIGPALLVVALLAALPDLRAEANNPQPCTITSKTKKHAADGTTADNRLTIGVCEKVDLTASAKAKKWSVDMGGDVDPKADSTTTVFTAGNKAVDKATVTAELADGTKCTITFKIIIPASAAWKKFDSKVTGYTNGNAGAQMKISNLTIGPMNVSFASIQVREKSGPPSDVTGYFANNPPWTVNAPEKGPPMVDAGILWHRAGGDAAGLGDGHFFAIGDNNVSVAGIVDTAGFPPPGIAPDTVAGGFKAGGFAWVIPYEFKCATDADATAAKFTDVTQKFTITAEGTMTVTKDDATIAKVTRAKGDP